MIKPLSSLRFFFAILVFMVHIGLFKVAIGHAFFIVLSGFILTMVYEGRLLRKEISWGNFLSKRLIRIYPLHILTLLLAIPVSMYIFNNIFLGIIMLGFNIFFLQTLIPNINFYFSFNGVSWNAADLMIFYAFFPFLIHLFSKLSLKKFSFFMLFIVMCIIISMQYVPSRLYHYVFYISPFLRIFDFIFGIYLFKWTTLLSARPKYKAATMMEIGVILLLILWYGFANLNSEVLRPYSYSVFLWLPISLIIIVFYMDAGLISRKILSTKLMVTLGGISYSFYMVHHLVIRYAAYINDSYLHYRQNFIYYSICFLIALLLAYLSNRYFESLFYKKKGKTA